MTSAPRLISLDHLVLTVANIPRCVAFYERALGMTAVQFTPADGTDRWSLKLGNQKINLHELGAEFDPKAKSPTAGSADLCFLSETPLSDWKAHLTNLDIPTEDGPVPRTGATGALFSIYIRDPDGNLIEISNRV